MNQKLNLLSIPIIWSSRIPCVQYGHAFWAATAVITKHQHKTSASGHYGGGGNFIHEVSNGFEGDDY